MHDKIELYQVIYQVLVTQIKFGTFSPGTSLPTIETASKLLSVSPDTIRAAYLRLKQEGYIALSKNIGAIVKVQYNKTDIAQHIQAYFAPRKDALIDISHSISPLFRHALFICLQKLSFEELNTLEQTTMADEHHIPFTIIYQYQLICGKLENDLFMRLVWKILIFFQAPFISISEHFKQFKIDSTPLLSILALCRKQDWEALKIAINDLLQQRLFVLHQFYEEMCISSEYSEPIHFSWSAYKKSTQLCYSLGIEILLAISRNIYPADCLLPSLSALAKEKQVSVSTVQRTIKLLNQIGAVRTDNGIGTRILPMEQSVEHCNFQDPLVRERLLDFLKSLQILALSCKDCAKQAVEAMDKNAVQDFLKLFSAMKQTQRLKLLVYTSLKFITYHSPLQTVKMVYTELLSLLIWGYPLRNIMHGNHASIIAFYGPYLIKFTKYIEQSDPDGFASALEELIRLEVQCATQHLARLGILKEAS